MSSKSKDDNKNLENKMKKDAGLILSFPTIKYRYTCISTLVSEIRYQGLTAMMINFIFN